MLSFKEVEDFLQQAIKEAKNKGGTALELFNIANVPVSLLTEDEAIIINKCLSTLLASRRYITQSSIKDYFAPGDFYFRNKGYLLIL